MIAILVAACGNSDDAVTTTDESPTPGISEAGVPFEATYAYDTTAISDIQALADQVVTRLELLGAGSISVNADHPGRLRIRITPSPGADPAATIGVATKTGALRFRPVLGTFPGGTDITLTVPAEDQSDRVVHLASAEGTTDAAEVYELGPTLVTGAAIETAVAQKEPTGVWSVAVTLRTGDDGIDTFNGATAECYERSPICPTGLLAIVLDSLVQSAPSIEQRSFEADQIQISGNFDQEDAEGLAAVLRTGALSTTLEPVAP